jgi:hypothetical protein
MRTPDAIDGTSAVRTGYRRAYQLAESLKKAVGCLTPSERRPREQTWTATVQAMKSN